MPIRLEAATTDDVPELVALRAAVAGKLTADHGPGPWSKASTAAGVRFDLRNSKVFVVRREAGLVASLRLTTKKPWAIDRSYFSKACRPLYLLSMAIRPDLQLQGMGRRCLEEVRKICRQWPADSLCLDAYAAPGGAGGFYAKCGFREVGRASYRGCPLVYFELQL